MEATPDAARLAAAPPKEKPYKITVGRGLVLLVNPNGSKLWRLNYRFGGVAKSLSFGPFPAITLPHAIKARDHVRFEDLPELLDKLDAAKIHFFTRCAIRLLVLTAVRPGELRAARWSEFNLDTATWTIPKERMKARRPHVVPLRANQ
ncbi:hypothetical protein D9M71_306130 [compost metagenome]